MNLTQRRRVAEKSGKNKTKEENPKSYIPLISWFLFLGFLCDSASLRETSWLNEEEPHAEAQSRREEKMGGAWSWTALRVGVNS
jgi:hypothetical protein